MIFFPAKVTSDPHAEVAADLDFSGAPESFFQKRWKRFEK
jgi:hypothetical protein